eukprot:CAMPEP_0184678524 /NCGR_PEP_ID=MMETSP0312-20130426/1282_1 /TAXON_ID=31354 /ORGANISM="Compsopogon coeruleus, Strain SAG 36.94" /LENGTH=334 /DNA_ID=CAMNT_0027127337 /DNA_START=1306 /DNA_END=2310 /DNA_ORIENTATION=+
MSETGFVGGVARGRLALNTVPTEYRACKVHGGIRMQTWSSERPRLEYFEFLEGKTDSAITRAGDVPSVLVGTGRIGNFLRTHPDDVVVGRGEKIPEDHPGPVYLCTRNDALEEILLHQCPPSKREDLVFLQNGMIEPILRKYALLDSATLVNVYFAVAKLGADAVDGITETNPEGLTVSTGKWAHAAADRLHSKGLTCRVVNSRDFRRSMLEKLIWICAFNLIGAVHGGITVGEVAAKHRREVDDMVDEMAVMVRYTLACPLFPGLSDRLVAYARAVSHFPTALKEFQWRNGWFYSFTLLARKNGFDDFTPMHTDYLVDGKARGLIHWDHEENL